jgi:type IV secretory pathway VirB10-like protein
LAGVVAASCVAAAAGGAYVAVRQNAVQQPPAASTAATPEAPAAGVKPVAETEAVVTPSPSPAPSAAPSAGRELRPEAEPPAPRRPVQAERAPARAEAPRPAPRVPSGRPVSAPNGSRESSTIPTAAERPAETTAVAPPVQEPAPEPARPIEPPPPPVPQFEEIVIPASSVIGLQVETALTSERAKVEDRVDARVARDVSFGGRVAIPAGSRVIGAVTLVEKGGKMKDRARLGVRFHTLVLADGHEIPLRTDAIFREGESPSAESARKIGGAAVGGAILGAIIGGGKGAAIGSAAGAAGGSAVVMAGDRNAATLPAGTIVNVRLVSPTTIEVEKH